ncbi:MAG: diguanylate cyclase [bacterium]|nr:diguanylate cyclase [bacterium]
MAEGGLRPRVLVVDDSRYYRELAKDVLCSRAEVECCANGAEALAALARTPADLVLSDLSMPGLSGLDLLQQVQREHPGTDFVLMTAHASVDSAVEALRVGAADYLQKPVGPEDLILVMERTLARRGLLTENRRLRDELAAFEACKTLTSCLEPEDVFAVGLDLVVQAAGAGAGFCLYGRPSLPGSHGFHTRGMDEDAEAQLRELVARGKRLTIEGEEGPERHQDGPFVHALQAARVDVCEALVVPVQGAETETGLFCIVHPTDSFSESAVARAAIVASFASVALQNAERYRMARERAFVDDVTDLYNARYLLEATDREVRRAERYGSALSVLFLDLDRFKLVNDRHGHLVGSGALRQLAQVLLQCVRTVDTVARYGGDEFTIILVDTEEEVASQIAERIRQAVETTSFEASEGITLRLTCSVGIAAYPTHGTGSAELLDAADKAMYRAKSNGRNKVCSASELD